MKSAGTPVLCRAFGWYSSFRPTLLALSIQPGTVGFTLEALKAFVDQLHRKEWVGVTAHDGLLSDCGLGLPCVGVNLRGREDAMMDWRGAPNPADSARIGG